MRIPYHLRRLPAAAAGLAAMLAAMPAAASPPETTGCRLALVLALDVSSSVDDDEHDLQREGLARALTDPDVERALLMGPPVALYVFEWASQSLQVPLLDHWTFVRRAQDLSAIVGRLRSTPRAAFSRRSKGTTGVGAALIHALSALEAVPQCLFRTVDVSGDGPNNIGTQPRDVYARLPFDGITVNGLAVGEPGHVPGAGGRNSGLGRWYSENVLRGPGAFLVYADGYNDFRDAMRRKLLRELRVMDMAETPGEELPPGFESLPEPPDTMPAPTGRRG